MNTKSKNIVSVIQSVAKNLGGTQWIPSGSFTALHMTKSTLYSVLCTLCIVLFLASCTDESLVDNPHAQNALRTVSVDLGMPQDKPAFGEGTTSRADLGAQTVEILLGDSTLAVSCAEGGSQSRSEGTSSAWVNGDQILVKIDAGSTQGRLTLQYIDPAAIPAPASGEEPQTATAGWYLMKDISYVKYTGDTFAAYNAQGVTPMIAGDTSDDDELAIDFTEELTLHLDWTASQPTVSIIYAPDMQWSLAQDNTVSMEQKNPATTATTAPELWTTNDNGWTTPQARLRVNTGNGNAGDVVTLTSKAFVSALETKPQDNVYTATTDDQGDAYFYGTINGVLKGNSEDNKFEIKLIQMRVPVPQPAPRASEGRSVALDDAKQNVIITLDTPITLLEASDVVPVTLAAETAYKLMADVKRTASAKTNLSVIDGSVGGKTEGTVDDVATVKAQIETAVAMDIYDFTVINQLARDYDPHEAETVVGQAIHDLASDERSPNYGKISITIADATELSNGAFFECYALKSVTFNQPVAIRGWVFRNCTALTGVDWANVASIGAAAFGGCTFTGPITINQGTELVMEAFEDCTITGTLTIGEGVTVDAAAFEGANVSGCDLVLPADQIGNVSAYNGNLMWAGAAWQSITLLDGPNGTAGTKYYIDNGMPTVEVDGSCGNKQTGDDDDVSAMTAKIGVVANAASKVIVKNGLATYDGGYSYPYTVVGMVIYTCGAANGSITLVLDETITSVPSSAFQWCNSLTSVSLPAAQEIGNYAFENCSSLTLVELPAAQKIGNYAFNNCTSLTSVNLPAAQEIGNSAFFYCTSLNSVSLPAATSIGEKAFGYCSALTSLTFGSVVQQVGSSVFSNSNTAGCDLNLAEDQLNPVTASGGKLMWAEAEWQSITVGGVQYKAVGNELYAVIDGTDSYLNLSTYVQKGNLKFYVVNGLSGITKAFTTSGTGANEGSISLILDEGITDIPSYAFQDCNALGSVVANGVTSIGYGAFSGTLAIEELTFKKVISCTSNYAFGQQPPYGNYWTFNCTLTLNESQSGVYEGDDIPSVTWGSCFWGCIKIGDYEYNMWS